MTMMMMRKKKVPIKRPGHSDENRQCEADPEVPEEPGPMRTSKARKEEIMTTKRMVRTRIKKGRTLDGNLACSSSRLAVEFPMVLNIGSVYSSHLILYLDP